MLTKDHIQCIIKDKNNKKYRLKATINHEENNIYRCGIPVKCNCTPEYKHTLRYDPLNNRVICTECGAESISLQRFREYEDDSLRLEYRGVDKITGQSLYSLNKTIPYHVWSGVEEYFFKHNSSVDVDLGFPTKGLLFTCNPIKVEEILNIKPVNSIRNRDLNRELEEFLTYYYNNDSVIAAPDMVDIKAILEELYEVFIFADAPEGKYRLKEHKIINPLKPPNEYGSGEYWCITDDNVWFVQLNFKPGAITDMNNVYFNNRLDAIGLRLNKDEAKIELLNKLDEYNKTYHDGVNGKSYI